MRCLVLALLTGHSLGFVPHAMPLRQLVQPLRAEATEAKPTDDEGKVYFASEVQEEGKTKFAKAFLDQGVPQYKDTIQESTNAGPTSYKGLIDGDNFDGGDGQVGCVGDGKNALDEFEVNEVLASSSDHRLRVKEGMVKESKARQMNAWGSSTGYADKLADQGMVKVDEYGEDKMKTRRQQLENWGNQQRLQSEQRAKLAELDRVTGQDGERTGSGWKRGARANYFDNLSKASAESSDSAWNAYQAPKGGATKSDGTAWKEVKLTGKERIVATIPVLSVNGRPGNGLVEVRNTVMTFEPYHTAFVGEDIEGFSVSPAEGTLNRRNGEPIALTVSFKSRGPGDARICKLVVETEEDKFVYQIEARTE